MILFYCFAILITSLISGFISSLLFKTKVSPSFKLPNISTLSGKETPCPTSTQPARLFSTLITNFFPNVVTLLKKVQKNTCLPAEYSAYNLQTCLISRNDLCS